jgi:S1-C subfamily serine protease
VTAAAVSDLTVVDWVALAVVALSALGGWRRGLIASALSLVGLVAGAYVGSRIGRRLLEGGAHSQWAAAASLLGALAGAALLQAAASLAGSVVRGGLRLTPFRLLDSLGGVVFGAVTGLVLVWVAAAAALLAPGQTQLRHEVQRSTIVRRLDEAVPPRRVLSLLARIDPFPSIAGPAAPEEPPSASVLRDPVIRRAAHSVVRVVGTACGVGVEGTGWFARADLVVTAAHVVAGERDTRVQIPGRRGLLAAQALVFDSRNDVAVLRVRGAGARALELAPAADGASVAIVGYPENGPLTSTAGRVGRTASVLTQDAYGHGPVSRTITALAGRVRHGNSGGPAIDSSGRVQATVFAARLHGSGGFGIPSEPVQRALARAQLPVSTGACASG